MNIIEHENNLLKVGHVPMDTDHILNPDFQPPLDSFLSGFAWAILGSRGSGKTNYLVDLLNKGKRKGKQCGFRNVFDQIFVVSPSMHTIKSKKNPFLDLDDEYKHKQLSIETLDIFEALCEEKDEEAEENDEEPPFNLLILDDVGASIRKNKELENKFAEFIFTIRHKHRCSIIMLLQHSAQIPPSIKSNITHLTTFKPKTHAEKENVFLLWTELERKYMTQFYNDIFKKDRDTLLIDMSKTNRKYYRNFNLLEFK